jgi:hypothetical protein
VIVGVGTHVTRGVGCLDGVGGCDVGGRDGDKVGVGHPVRGGVGRGTGRHVREGVAIGVGLVDEASGVAGTGVGVGDTPTGTETTGVGCGLG